MGVRLPTASGDEELRDLRERIEWCRDRLIELTGVDGAGGTVATIIQTQKESASSQGQRIGAVEGRTGALEGQMAEQVGFKRSLLVLGAIGMLVLGAVISRLVERFL